VAKKEHAQIVSVLKSIESLPPGLWAMKIAERKGANGSPKGRDRSAKGLDGAPKGRDREPEYEVSFEERRLEDVAAQLNRFKRADEKPFESVAAISDFNQRAYELFMQPLVQASSGEYAGKLRRQFHPLRMQRWGLSDLNPWLAWTAPAASMVRAQRQQTGRDNAVRKIEQTASDAISASLDYYRAMRDAMSEAAFFLAYGNLFALRIADKRLEGTEGSGGAVNPRELPFVKEALASIAEGGFPEALARVACLLAHKGEPMLLSRLETKRELLQDYKDLLPVMSPDQWRRMRGEQEIIVRYAPEDALATLPQLLRHEADRSRLATLVQRLLADDRVRRAKPSSEQVALIQQLQRSLAGKTKRSPTRPRASSRKRAAKRGGAHA